TTDHNGEIYDSIYFGFVIRLVCSRLAGAIRGDPNTGAALPNQRISQPKRVEYSRAFESRCKDLPRTLHQRGPRKCICRYPGTYGSTGLYNVRFYYLWFC